MGWKKSLWDKSIAARLSTISRPRRDSPTKSQGSRPHKRGSPTGTLTASSKQLADFGGPSHGNQDEKTGIQRERLSRQDRRRQNGCILSPGPDGFLPGRSCRL